MLNCSSFQARQMAPLPVEHTESSVKLDSLLSDLVTRCANRSRPPCFIMIFEHALTPAIADIHSRTVFRFSLVHDAVNLSNTSYTLISMSSLSKSHFTRSENHRDRCVVDLNFAKRNHLVPGFYRTDSCGLHLPGLEPGR